MASFATQISNIATALHTAHTVIDAITGETFEHAQLIRGANSDEWIYSTANEFGHLTKGILPHMPSGTETVTYIRHDDLPHGRKATYARFLANKGPHKIEKKRVRLTVGGNLIHYPDKVSTPSADLTTIKILIFDLKEFYIGTPMVRKEYMCIDITSIPHSIIDQYHLLDLVHNGFLFWSQLAAACMASHKQAS
jgi:hypothetical protein